MRQGNGTDLLGMNDPRSATIGVIYVSPVDDRKSVLAAILTQENLNRQHIVVVLPNPNNAFQRPQDFDDLKSVQRKRKLQGEIIFIAPDGPGPAEFARQRRFPVYATPEEYTQALRDGEEDENFSEPEPEQVPEKRSRFFGGRAKTTGAAAAGAIAGAAAARHESLDASDEPQSTMIFPGYKGPNQQPDRQSRQTQAPATPRVPNTPNRSTLDDDDDLGNDPITPPTRNPNIAGAAALGAGAGLAEESFRRSPSAVPSGNLDDDDDKAEKTPTRGPADTASRSPRNSNPLQENPNAAANSGTPGGPGIIDLQPVTPKGSGRNPATGPTKVNEPPLSTPIPEDLDADDEFVPPPPTHGARRRRTGSMATGAAGAAGAGAFAAIGAGSANTGPHAISSGPGNTLVGPITPIQYPPSRNVPPQRPDRTGRPRRGRRALIFLLLLLLMLVLGTCLLAYINPAVLPMGIGKQIAQVIPAGNAVSPATVTITPKSQVVSDTYVIQAVTTAPNANLLQVSLQHLTATPDPQTKTVTGTGHTQTDPTQATGFVTLYNSSLKPVTIGIVSFPQVSNGVTIVTNGSVTIGAATVDGNGTLTSTHKAVAAHTTNTGTIGNIAARALSYNDCCAAGLLAINLTPFTGGQDSQNYTFIQQSDVQAVVNPLVTTLQQEAKSQFNKQLTANESMAQDPNCPQPTINDDPGAIGDRGHSITSMTVTVSATCTGIAYDRDGAQKVAQQRLQKNADTNPGKGYALSGAVTSKITKVTPQSQGAVSLQVQAQGTWDYQVSAEQQTALAKQLAGKKVTDAQALLNAQPGFKDATIKSDGNNASLPTDPNQIKIDVLSVSGSNNGSSTPGSSTPAPSSSPVVTPTSAAKQTTIPAETLKG